LTKLTPILQNLIYTNYLAELLPFILGLIFIRKIKLKGSKVFFFYTTCVAIFLLFSIYSKFVLHDRSKQLLTNRFFLILEFVLLSLYYFNNLQFKFKKSFFAIACGLFIGFSVYDYIITQDPTEFSFQPLVVECLFFALVIIYFFFEKLKYNITSPIIYNAAFWVSAGFLVYFTGNFFLFLFSKSNQHDPDFKTQYTIIYSTVTISKNILLSIAVLISAYIQDHQSGLHKPMDIDLGTFNPLKTTTNQ
jgi:hypothetical protein